MIHASEAELPSRDSREYQIIKTLLRVDSKGKAQGDDFKAMLDIGVDVIEQLTYLFIDHSRADVLDKMSMGEISSNAFHIAVFNWARGLTPPEPAKQGDES